MQIRLLHNFGVWRVPTNQIGPWGMQGGLKGYKGMQEDVKGDTKQGKWANQIMDIHLCHLTSLSHFPLHPLVPHYVP